MSKAKSVTNPSVSNFDDIDNFKQAVAGFINFSVCAGLHPAALKFYKSGYTRDVYCEDLEVGTKKAPKKINCYLDTNTRFKTSEEGEPLIIDGIKLIPLNVSISVSNNSRNSYPKTQGVSSKRISQSIKDLSFIFECATLKKSKVFDTISLLLSSIKLLPNRITDKGKSGTVEQLKALNKTFPFKAYAVANNEELDNNFIVLHYPEINDWIAITARDISEENCAYVMMGRKFNSVVSSEIKYFSTCDLLNIFNQSHNKNVVDLTLGQSANSSEVYITLDKNRSRDTGNFTFTLDEAVQTPTSEDLIDCVISDFEAVQEDQYISEEELAGQPLTWLCGSEENLEARIKELVYTTFPLDLWPLITNSSSDYLEFDICAADEDEPTHLVVENMRYDTSGFEALDTLFNNTFSNDTVAKDIAYKFYNLLEAAVDAILALNTPQGHSWEYNDGAYDRKSGYDKSGAKISITVSAPSAHVVAETKMTSDLHTIVPKETLEEMSKILNKLVKDAKE